MTDNPFFEPWTTPFEAPPFDRIGPEHFRPAYDRALKEHAAEIAAIADSAAPPDFENTIVALEDSGQLLRKVEAVFHNLASSHTNDALQQVERDMAPVLAKHWNEIYLNAKLFARIDALAESRATLGLDAESLRVLERYHLDFVRAGAKLQGRNKERLASVVEELASLGTSFGQNVLADEQAYILPLSEADMAGVPDFAREAAAETAKERGLDAPYAATTSRSSVEPILSFADNRELREKLFKAWTARGANLNEHNNLKLIGEIVALRAERAKLLGYPTFAHYKLADTMAKTPDAARHLLDQVWLPARRRALEERDALQAMIAEGRRQFRARRLGLALLCREAAQGTLRLRRSRGDALFPARQDDRRGVRHGAPAVRARFRRAQGRAGLSPRCAGMGGEPRRRACRAVLWRLFRAQLQARRRLDELVPRAGESEAAGDAA